MTTKSKRKNHRMLAHSVASSMLSDVLFGGVSSTNDDFTTIVKSSQDDTISVTFCECFELEKKFAPKHQASLLLAASYGRLGEAMKAMRVADCGTFLEFAHAITDGVIDDKGMLHNANFCRDRLCPMCAWRRSYKIFAQVSQIMQRIGSSYKFIFLTLTVPSCAPDELVETLQRLFNAWTRLINRKAFKKAVRGFFRALEITYNNNRRSKSYRTYHPHFHCILAVPLDYAESDLYISHDKWLDLWRECYKDDSITQVHVQFAHPKDSESEDYADALKSAVAEVAKYSVKSKDYIIEGNEELTDEIVSCLSSALWHRRLSQFGGIFQKIALELKLDDAEDGDLIHLTVDINSSLAYMIVRYGWSAGVYKMIDSHILQPKSDE